MPPKEKYSDPKLRDEVKEDIKQSDKGGEPGQWSARKAQMMAKEYKKRGGDYNTSKSSKDESQKNLDNWGEEDWQTKEGSGDAKNEDGSRKRYLPKKAWEQMSEREKEETDEKKQEESKKGKQFVGNTGKARNARKNASKDNEDQDNEKNKEEGEEEEEEEEEEEDENENNKANGDEDEGSDNDKKQNKKKRSRRKGPQKKSADKAQSQKQNKQNSSNGTRASVKSSGEEDDAEDNDSDASEDSSSKDSSSKENELPSRGQKRGRGAKEEETKNEESTSSKKQKTSDATVGSKHDKAEAPAKQGSNSRLPKKGQKKVHWKALPGWVEGEVVEIVRADKEVDGKKVKASKQEPKVVLKSKSSGKICVHKADNVYFD